MIATLILAAALNVMVSSPKPLPTEVPSCVEFFHQACSEAIGKWLPEMGGWYSSTPDDRAAKRVAFTDAFIYEGRKPTWSTSPYPQWISGFPKDGTFFVYGIAGPPKGHLVYDYAHRIAFYNQGCCGWSEVVAATGVSNPPKRVVSRDLTSLRTVRGVQLGQTIAEVLRLYDGGTPMSISGQPSMRKLFYGHMFDKNCGQSQVFIFKNGRLIYIALIDSC